MNLRAHAKGVLGVQLILKYPLQALAPIGPRFGVNS
jgi:hypothetical protein